MMLVMIAPNPKIDIAMPSTQKVQLWMVLYLSISKWPQWLVFKSESDVKAAEVLSLRPSKSSNSSIAFKCLSVCERKRTDGSKMRNKHLACALLLRKKAASSLFIWTSRSSTLLVWQLSFCFWLRYKNGNVTIGYSIDLIRKSWHQNKSKASWFIGFSLMCLRFQLENNL